MKLYKNPAKENWKEILERPSVNNEGIKKTVAGILDDIKINGDAAVKKYSKQFDGLESDSMLVSAAEIELATTKVAESLKEAIDVAYNNIKKFHESQREDIKKIETSKGVFCWRKSVPIQNVGLYIPGGTAPLLSTLLMLGVPANLAGCHNIIICTPADKSDSINDAILYIAGMLNIKYVYKIGGAQAIGAMAFGTETIPKVDKIFGPGNRYVTTAKQMVQTEGTAIDMPAGPSELAVFADHTSNPAFIAADLLSQAEHGADSQVLLVTTYAPMMEKVQIALEEQLHALPRKDIATAALSNSMFIEMDKLEEAFNLLNEYAAEHLIIATDDAEVLSEKVFNAGSIFLGHYSPESAGDYASGTNHTLPTNGFAKAYSGVSLDSFVKKITFQNIQPAGLQNLGKAVEILAAAEGLQAHKNAVSIRLETLKNEQ